MYAEAPRQDILYQGDVFEDVIVVEPPQEILVVTRHPRYRTLLRTALLEDSPYAFPNGRDAIIAEATRIHVAIMSQSCDVQRKQFVTLAAVLPLPSDWGSGKRQDVQRIDKHLDSFYLAAAGGFPESIIQFTMLYSVQREKLLAQRHKRILTLSLEARQRLQYKFGNFFFRPAEE
ncbi:MAG: hypothetical protein KKI08_01260 [Armatimonadetes bacterium]|nr:hypothetical protein [Armatimonadota bacterium]